MKRIVITSSCGAVMAPPPQPTIFSETDWNTSSQMDIDKNGVNADPLSKYRVSKTLAEKGAAVFSAPVMGYLLTKSQPHGSFTKSIKAVLDGN